MNGSRTIHAVHYQAWMPYTWFGGKRAIAGAVRAAFSHCTGYAEPFLGGAGVLIYGRFYTKRFAIAGDLNGFVTNVWRAIQQAPDDVARYAFDWCSQVDYWSRQLYIMRAYKGLLTRLIADPEYCDPKIAGWWLYARALSIGARAASGTGPWWVDEARRIRADASRAGVIELTKQILETGDAPVGGVSFQVPNVRADNAVLSCNSVDELRQRLSWFSEVLKRVRFICSDWRAFQGDGVLNLAEDVTGVFLDPPYHQEANKDAYGLRTEVAVEAARWAVSRGDDPRLAIIYCAYDGFENVVPELNAWRKVVWRAPKGFSTRSETKRKRANEAFWLSPQCQPIERVQEPLFEDFS
jgi:hypothetical protein